MRMTILQKRFRLRFRKNLRKIAVPLKKGELKGDKRLNPTGLGQR